MPGDEKVSDPVADAEQMLRTGRREEAGGVLGELLQNLPKGWKPVRKQKDGLAIAFWDQMEFFSYIAFVKGDSKKKDEKVIWDFPSYSKAYYLMAFIAVEQSDWKTGLELINKAIKLEPDHPTLLCEKALILGRIGKPRDALDVYIEASKAREWAPADQHARAQRGAAIALIDLGDLDKAEAMLNDSLSVEPGNRVALNELQYIKKLRAGGAPTKEYDLVRKR
jgi:tetratricopeptide (TPR) repeat protein